RRHTRCLSDWSSDVCSSDLAISLALKFLVHEFMAWHSGHHLEQTWVANVASTQLAFHHLPAKDRHAVRLAVVGHFRKSHLRVQSRLCLGLELLRRFFYFLRCRRRTSMPTTPFWSLTAIIDMFLVM